MEYFIGIVFGLVAIIVFAMFIYRLYELLEALVNIPVTHLRIQKPLTRKDRTLLEKYSAFYQSLNTQGRKEFEKRLNYFLINKQFIKRGNHRITYDKKLLISAMAVQLTFGLRRTFFQSFPNILIYPGKYFSQITNRSHKGEVNPAGVIVLSWEDFMEGLKNPDDGINLGLHEFAHALALEDATRDEEYALIDHAALRKWHRISGKELKKVRSGENTFIRKYGGTNRDEFFAVCVEQFFEQPEAFFDSLPELYTALAKLLNQDPAKKLIMAG